MTWEKVFIVDCYRSKRPGIHVNTVFWISIHIIFLFCKLSPFFWGGGGVYIQFKSMRFVFICTDCFSINRSSCKGKVNGISALCLAFNFFYTVYMGGGGYRVLGHRQIHLPQSPFTSQFFSQFVLPSMSLIFLRPPFPHTHNVLYKSPSCGVFNFGSALFSKMKKATSTWAKRLFKLFYAFYKLT